MTVYQLMMELLLLFQYLVDKSKQQSPISFPG